MTTKAPLQKIVQGIQDTDDDSKQNHERIESIKP
jgi:hypothetical protein